MLVMSHPVFRRFWYPIIPLAQLADGPKPFTLLGTNIVLWLDQDGEPAAALDRCCHRTAKLSLGFCEDGNIVCGYHGWTFDRDGRCVRVPQRASSEPMKSDFGIPAYRTAVRHGYVWVALEEPMYGLPDLEEAREPGFRLIHQFYEEWNCSGLRLMENSFDIAHPAYVHRKTFGIQSDPMPTMPDVTPFDGGFNYFAESRVKNNDIQKKNLQMVGEAETVRRRTNTWWMPFCRKLGITYPNGLRHTIFTGATPIDDHRSMVVQFCYRNDTEEQAPAADIIAFDREVTFEDKYILEGTEADVPLSDDTGREISMPSDKPGVIMRRMLSELIERSEGPTPVANAAE
jgi:phenylpropionate dioxygenase-like ring-hydroxylating dioxygenase large terminal subunit